MIKNIIFDMGGVLVNYTPDEHLEDKGLNKEEAKAVIEAMFSSNLWQEFDRGTYKYSQAPEIFSNGDPVLAKNIAKALATPFNKMHTLKEETSDFLKELKKEGFKIYILSNFPDESFQDIYKKFDYFNYVDECIVSGQINMIKPDKDIYEYMLKKLDIIPEESIFIDDVQKNLDTANQLGIKTVLFTDIDDAKAKVRALINE